MFRQLALALLAFGSTSAFAPVSVRRRPTTTTAVLSSSASPSVETLVLDGDAHSIQRAAEFMMDAFWLGDERLQQPPGASISDAAKANLLQDQMLDFTEKYGERMGSRLLESCLVTAVDETSNALLGLVSLEVCLLEDGSDLMPAPAAESLLKNAVASLGPKQRREFKNSSAQEIGQQLLPTTQQVVVSLSNLAISPQARRRGIAVKLCQSVEQLARGEGFDRLYLKVEKENEPALRLYQDKLGYQEVNSLDQSTVVRIDLNKGAFVKTEADMLILAKNL